MKKTLTAALAWPSIIFFLLIASGYKASDLWLIGIILIMFIIIIIMFIQFESRKITSKEISLVAVLSAVSAVSRIPFAAIPSVQPCTFIIMCTGYVFGPTAGFMVGATTALVSNIFLGQGPWTFFQMFAWGMIGASASLLNKLNAKRFGLIVFGVTWGYLFGWIMNLWYWLLYIYPHTIYTFGFTIFSSIWFDTLHAFSNVVFILLLSERTIKILKRYRDRFHIEYGKKTPIIIDYNKEPLNA